MSTCKQGMGASYEQIVALGRCGEQPGSALQAGATNVLEVVQTENLTELLLPHRAGGNGVTVPVLNDKSHHQQIP